MAPDLALLLPLQADTSEKDYAAVSLQGSTIRHQGMQAAKSDRPRPRTRLPLVSKDTPSHSTTSSHAFKPPAGFHGPAKSLPDNHDQDAFVTGAAEAGNRHPTIPQQSPFQGAHESPHEEDAGQDPGQAAKAGHPPALELPPRHLMGVCGGHQFIQICSPVHLKALRIHSSTHPRV